ncbi:MAG: hypothetical protein LBC73_09430, partial [Oscillospiraceae bacterium]|nr:hypothetical protein [Oscillospiraceae bacterium]
LLNMKIIAINNNRVGCRGASAGRLRANKQNLMKKWGNSNQCLLLARKIIFMYNTKTQYKKRRERPCKQK